MSSENQDLFIPTLQEDARSRPITSKKPWRLRSQFWVAFFGGVLASSVITYLNAKRLGIRGQRLGLIALLGAGGLVVTVALTYYLRGLEATPRTISQYVRLGSRVIAVLMFGVFYSLQKGPDRTYSYYSDEPEEYSSLWKPGLAAVVGLGLLQALAVGGLLAWFDRL